MRVGEVEGKTDTESSVHSSNNALGTNYGKYFQPWSIRQSMGSPSAKQHDDLLQEHKELLQARDEFTRTALPDIFKCFSSISGAKQVLSGTAGRFGTFVSIGEQIKSDLEGFEGSCWTSFETDLIALKEAGQRERIQRQKMLNGKILKLLRTQIDLPAVLRLVSHLKAQSSFIPLQSLPSVFIQCREVYISNSILANDPGKASGPGEMFQRSCVAMREPVLSVLTEYTSLFTEIPPVSQMLCKRFAWFFEALQEAISQTDKLLDLASHWNELVVLESSYNIYSVSLMPFIDSILIERGAEIATKPLDKSVALFIASLGKTVVPEEPASIKSIPAFILLTNAINQMFKEATCFCPPQFVPSFQAAVDHKLRPVEDALQAEDRRALRELFETQFRPYLTGMFAKLIKASPE